MVPSPRSHPDLALTLGYGIHGVRRLLNVSRSTCRSTTNPTTPVLRFATCSFRSGSARTRSSDLNRKEQGDARGGTQTQPHACAGTCRAS